MRLALDSNRYSDFRRGDKRVVAALEGAAEIHVPLIVIAEQRAGFLHGTKREINERDLVDFLNRRDVHTLKPDEQTTFVYAELWHYLRTKGRPIPTNDVWIAALTIQHNLVLLDRDSHFDHLPQLVRLRLPD